MTRMYIQPSWIDAAADHNEWSGGNGQYRGDRSSDLATFDKNGRARVEAFTDEAIEARKAKPASKVSIKNQILPQAARVERLTQQMRDLVISYKAGEMDINEYSLLLDILSAKKDRAEVLLKKALEQKPIRDDDAEPVKASVKHCTTTFFMSSHIKQKACQVWTEARMFLVGSVAACAGLMWLAN